MTERTLGHYAIVETIGEGAMGTVYRARDTKLGRDVALKVLPDELAADPDRLDRFQREARALAAIDHPNIVTIFSVEEQAGVHFLTMALVDGESLQDKLARGPAIRQASSTLGRDLQRTAPAGLILTRHRDPTRHFLHYRAKSH